MNKLPKLTDDERRENLRRGIEERSKRAAYKARVKAGEVSVADALEEPLMQRVRVREFLLAVPGVGERRRDGIMAELLIPHGRRVQGLGPRQRERLLGVLSK